MRKLSVLAMIAAVLVTGTVFAADGRLTVQPNAPFIVPGASAGAAIAPATTNNDDSCDIGVAPAATLLLPYFEVDLGTAGTGRTTLFSVTNVSALSQIAHVTVWTDWSYPVLDFNIFLTGYDVQPINLYDVIARGLIGGTTGTSTSAPNARTSSGTVTNPNNGTTPFSTAASNNFGNPNFLGSVGANCAPGRLPGQLPGPLATDVRAVLSTGRSTGVGISCPLSSGAEAQVGGNHGGNVAIGYVTIDVAATCSTSLPIDAGYFSGEILFDNVLIGDYQDVNQSATAGNYAGGNPLVHIRAIPEGGGAGQAPAGVTNLPYTFYDRYTTTAADRRFDRRQPLPSAFAARWISGTTAAFDTQYKIWREGLTGSSASCSSYILNSDIGVAEIVRFDERENASVLGGGVIVSPPPPGQPGLPEASRTAVTSSLFPSISTTDAGGWMYLNLSNGGTSAGAPYSASRPGFSATQTGRDNSQNWVIVSMFAEGRYGVDFDAAWLGNGCSAPFPSTASASSLTALNRVGPAGGVLVCPPGTTTTIGTVTQCVGTNTTP